MIIFGIFFLFLNYEDPNLSLIDKDKYKYLELCLRLFRMTTVFIYIIFATGYVIQTFKEYKINYLMIFGLDPLMKMTHIQLYRVSFFLLLIQSIFFTMTMM